MHDVSEAALFLPSGKEAPNLVDSLDQATHSHSVHLVIHAPENRSSPSVVTAEWLSEN